MFWKSRQLKQSLIHVFLCFCFGWDSGRWHGIQRKQCQCAPMWSVKKENRDLEYHTNHEVSLVWSFICVQLSMPVHITKSNFKWCWCEFDSFSWGEKVFDLLPPIQSFLSWLVQSGKINKRSTIYVHIYICVIMLDDENDKHQVGTNSLNAPTTEREAS